MCGIAGWYRRRGRPVHREVLARQCDSIIHRGPDDFGLFEDGDFGFGMRRLSIIDLDGGHQPIFSPDQRYAIVYNGEIYNHLDLRADLEAKGVRFATNSDTETVLYAFLQWGEDAWLRLEGMYAVAIWDRETRRLTLARDPLGIKPLYMTEQHGGLAFASEIRALRVLPDHDFDIDPRGAHDFFTFGHIQKPRSIFRQIRSLPPGHSLHLGPEGDAKLRAFWAPQFRPCHEKSEAEWIEETRARVEETVTRHMLADVQVGAFLSGGVDSSAITAAMSKTAAQPVKAFTVGFPNTSIDETAAAARIARHLGCEHIVLPLKPAAAGDMLPAVQAAFDEPCAATAAVPIWHLSKLAAEHVKVVLCGEGADEVFAGYKRQRTAMMAARMHPVSSVAAPIVDLVSAISGGWSKDWNYKLHNAQKFLASSRLRNNFQRFFAGTQISSPALRARLYCNDFQAAQEASSPFASLDQEYFNDENRRRLTPLQQFMLADITIHMPGSLLNRLDRASMAHSLEARVPFLSHKFIDWCLTVPEAMKMRGKTGKYVLRKAVEPWLPPDALGKRKLGFQLPFAEWFSGDFSDFAQEAWRESGAADCGFLNPQTVDDLFAEHKSGKANHGRILYAIAMFSCWQQSQAENAAQTKRLQIQQ